MRIILIGKNYIFKDILPNNIVENYWIVKKIGRNEKKLVNIKEKNGKYEIISDQNLKIIDSKYLEIKNENLIINNLSKSIIPNVILEENCTYPILLNDSKEIYILYCLPDFENNFIHVDNVGAREITIGSDESNNIICRDEKLISKTHARIFKFNGKWTIENNDSQFGVFVNDFPVYNNTKNIFNGDIIFIMGLEIIMIKDSLYINNSRNNIVLEDKCFEVSKIKNNNVDIKKIEEKEKSIDNEKKIINYYSRSPRMMPKIKKETINIDEPPQLSEDKQKPMILMIGSSLAIGIMMIASLSTTIQGIINKTAGIIEITVGIITVIAMLIAILLIPILDIKWDKKSKKKYEQKRQRRYKQYLKNKNELINEIKNKQKEILFKNYLSADECANIILSNDHRLWERKIDHDDFLDIRVGLGRVPLKIDISYPQEKFTMVDDNLETDLNELIENSKTIDDSPVTVSLYKNRITSIISNDEKIRNRYIKNIILQLITFHSYEDLKLVFLTNGENSEDWKYVKMLPHIWDDLKQIRFFADNYDDMNEISKYLLEEINSRQRNNNEEEKFSPHYLIITDDYKQIENLSFISSFIKSKKNIGLSLLCITDDIYTLPSECEKFIYIKDNIDGLLFEKGADSSNQLEIKLDPLITVFFDKIAEIIANIPIRTKNITNTLPNSYTFLEMYNAGNIKQLNILDRWKKNDSTLSLKAPIGIDSNGMIISLDAHEKFHGPHGLIAGSTGSGKSEFIITYILSLAINYHPNDVNFLLIDYKGGGLAGAFQKNNIILPHLSGTITNIDKAGLNRSLVSIQSELKRRQIMFNEARNMTNEGTIDIYKYQRLYHEGIVKEPIPHLFIICDEFAELKQQQPEFMDELISVSRIGRSLGVHLILATQKPNGIVDDQIRSNSKFAICLKVQDTIDSKDVISTPDAAYLKNAGQFYLKVGQNEYFILGQSGWTGAPYIESNNPIKKIDNSVEFISNTGMIIKKIDDKKQQNYANKGEQLTNLLNYIYSIAKEENIKPRKLWLENIPVDIYVNQLKEKYNVKKQKNEIKAIIGEYDDPSNQKQGLVELDFIKRENILVYGNAESGKETLLSTMIYDLMTTYTTKQIQMYILDFGTEALKIYKNSPHVGDIIFMGQDEKLQIFFEIVQKIIKDRKQILSNYNGNYDLYISNGNIMPIINIIINNYEDFYENYGEKYEDLFLTLTREGTKCGVVFVVTASSYNAMRYRLTSNFYKKIVLQLNNDDDYYSIFENVKGKKPAHLFGRGLLSINNELFEFQTAKICEHINYNEQIEQAIEQANIQNEEKAIPIPILPEKIELEDMKPYLKDIKNLPIGFIKKNLDVYTYNFSKKFVTVISSNRLKDAINLSTYILEEAKELRNVKIKVLDSEKVKNNKEKAYKNFIKEINSELKNDDDTFILCAIIGINKFINEDIIDEYEFSDFLEKVKEKGKHSFIIIENSDMFEEHTYDAWYTNFIDQSSGIWVGNGIENQTLINTNFSMEGLNNNCGNSYGYVVDEGVTTLVKFIGVEEEGDKDE